MSEPTSREAAAALDELEAGRRAVEIAETRGMPVLLAGWSALVLVDHIAKDHVPDRRGRLAISWACAGATLAMGMLDHRSNPVQPVDVGEPRGDLAPRLGAALLGWALVERALIVGLRRSGVRRPNTLAGVALAVGRPLGYVGLRRLLTTTRPDG